MKPTREQILGATLDQLDLWVAEFIFNQSCWAFNEQGAWAPVMFTRYIYKSWRIVEKLADKYRFRLSDISAGNKLWQAAFEIRDGHYRFPIEHAHKGDAHADERTPPLAICRAALLAVLEDDN